jgi:predicted SprT family Zn-dependent metalloprotease
MTHTPRHQRRAEARKLAVESMARHGLHDWTFQFNWRKRSMGLCRYAVKTLELSVHLVDRNGPDEILDTILHEIAHALVGPGHGHDAVWRRKCVEIGATPKRCGHAEMPEGRWRAECATCGARFDRHRKPQRMKGWFCRGCGPERGALVWRQASAAAS